MIVQVNVPQCPYKNDPDLATITRDNLPKVFQMLCVCSGCDYISYFAGMGKAVFCNIFFQHASFITGSRMPGELLFSTADKIEQNFLSFLRLIGTLYFKKHFSAMVSLRGTETLLNSQKTSMDHTKQHECLYD